MRAFWLLLVSIASILSAGEHTDASSRPDTLWMWKGTPIHSTRWAFLGDHRISWYSSETDEVVDSLVLRWPKHIEATSQARLSFALTGQGDQAAAFLQVGLLSPDTISVLPLPYTHASTELPGKDAPNSYSSTVATSVVAQADLTASQGIIIRIVTPQGNGSGTAFVLDSLCIAEGDRVTPLVPFPKPEEFPSDTVSARSAVWHIPETTDVIWKLLSPWRMEPIPTVAMATTAITGYGYDRDAFQMQWAFSRDLPCLEFTDVWGGYADPLTFLRRTLYIQSTGEQAAESTTVRFSLTMPGIPLVVSEPVMLFRSPLPQPGEVRINELGISPSESEFVELRSLLQWPLGLGTYTLQIGDKDYSLPDHLVVAPLDVVQLTMADIDGLVLPNVRSQVRLLREESVIDSVSYGPTENLPSAPYGWSLARKNGEWILESDPSPGAQNSRFEPPAHECHALVLSELSLWPDDTENAFIEITNTGSSSVSLENWTLLCEDVYACPSDHVLDPGDLFLVESQQFPPYFLLNPDEGSIVLVQPNGVMADRCSWTEAPDPGHSLHRPSSSHPAELNWIAAPPSPGIEPTLFESSHFEIQVSRTNDGVVIQWTCSENDSLQYHIYRAQVGSPTDAERISTFPIRGQAPYSFVDITAEAGESYLYWVAPDPHATQVEWFGPAHIPPAPEDISLILESPKPNPFRNEVVVSYTVESLPERLLSEVLEEFPPGRRMKLGVYNVNGRLVRVLVADVLEEGRRSVTWDGRDENGQICPPGVYVISLQIGTRVRSVKAVFTGNEVGMSSGGSMR